MHENKEYKLQCRMQMIWRKQRADEYNCKAEQAVRHTIWKYLTVHTESGRIGSRWEIILLEDSKRGKKVCEGNGFPKA